jgi:uncharacterized protein YndB with AHSA1/START domain
MSVNTASAVGTESGLRTVQVHRVYIKAPAERVWQAITDPEWTDRYGYGGIVDAKLEPGAAWVTNAGAGMQAVGITGPIVDGEVIEVDPPHRLVQTWRMLMDPQTKDEGFTRLTYDLAENDGVTKLTVTHDVTGAPRLGLMTSGHDEEMESRGGGGGWPWILSDLKTLLETGQAFTRSGLGG